MAGPRISPASEPNWFRDKYNSFKYLAFCKIKYMYENKQSLTKRNDKELFEAPLLLF